MAEQPIIDIVLPTYRLEPEEKERFYPSVAKAIANRVLQDELGGQTFDEEDAKNWSMNISDKIRESLHGLNKRLADFLYFYVFITLQRCY